MIHLLDFPDELLCDVFAYLSAFDAIHLFFNLNSRLNRLLLPFKQQVDLTDLSYGHVSTYLHRYLPALSPTYPLLRIKLGNERTPGQLELFNDLLSNQQYRHYFHQVTHVLLESARLEELTVFVEQYLLTLPQLETFILRVHHIRDEQFQEWTRLIVNSILSISRLRKLSIDMSCGLVLARLPDTTMLNSLVDVRLNLTMITDLLILLPHIPHVELLFIRIGWWASADQTLVKMLDPTSTSPGNAMSVLPRLRKFHLTIDSVLSFLLDHLGRVLRRIINEHTTSDFSFTLRYCLNKEAQLLQLINGKTWENLLSDFASLKAFHLFICMSDVASVDTDNDCLDSFKTGFFFQRHWFFSCLKRSTTRDQLLLYSIPYRRRELFDIIIHEDGFSEPLPMNFTSVLSIGQTSNVRDPSTFQWILNHFPALEELRLSQFRLDCSRIGPLALPSLHRLKIEKGGDENLFDLLRLLPLINSLSLPYATVFHHRSDR